MPKGGGSKTIRIVERKTTEVHVAAQKGETARLKLLLENGAPVDVLDKDEATPLHHAAYHGQLKCAKKLLECGADVELKDTEGSTALHNAAFQGYTEIMELLVKKGASIDVEDLQGGTPLLNAACNGHDEALKFLLKKSAAVAVKDANGASPLHYASYNGHAGVIRLLLNAGAEVNAKDNEGVTPLHHACGNGHVQAVRALVDGKADVDAEDEQGTTPLHAAAFNNHVIVIQILLQHASQNFGADLRLMLLSKQDKEGSTPLHKATFNGDVEVVKMFLESGVDLNALDKEGSTPLHKAAYKGNASIMQLLLAKSAALDIRDNQGGTALYNACYNGHTMCVNMLLEASGADEAINLKDNHGRTPLHASACFGHWECVNLLLNHQADPDAQDDDGLTPLHLGAFNGSYLSVSFLLNSNANFRIKTKDGINPLHYASYNGHLSTVHLLMERDAPVDCLDDRNVTPLHYAAACNHWDIIRYLLFKGADVDFANKEGLTPLSYAAKNGALDAATILIENGADPDLKNDKGSTARKLAKGNRSNPCREIFDSLGRKPFSPEALAMLSDVRNKLNRRRKRKDDKKGVQGGIDNLPGLGNVSRLSSPFSEHGIDFDLNDVAEIAEKVHMTSKKLKEHWSFLNVMRHLLLIPNDEVNGRKMWALIEMFCNQVVLIDPTDTTKMTFPEFLPMYRSKDSVTKIKKLDMLVGVENALPILFPNMPEQDEFGEVMWRPGDLLGEGYEGEDSEYEDDEDYPEEKKSKKKIKKKRKAEDSDDEEESEYETDEEDRPRKGKGKQWNPQGNKRGADAPLAENEMGVVAKVPTNSVKKVYDGDDQDEWEKMMQAQKTPKGGPPMAAGPGGGPPPPPPPPGGGPPPPPGGPGGPPPPPGAAKAIPAPLPPGRKELEDIKLRKLPWKKIPLGKINKTVWDMFKENCVEIDVPLIIEYFQERKDEKKEEKKPKKQRKQVLDLKRANHIGLMLSMAKGRTYAEIRQGIIDLDESIFTEDLLRAFVKLTPQKTDIEMLTPFKNLTPEQKLELGDADQFFLEIMDIPRLESRISAFLFKKTFEILYAELAAMVKDASESIKTVSTNFKLAKLLEIILNIGNFLNYGTYAGNAFGYGMDSLLKLRDTKSTKQNDYTVLHYLAQYMTENRAKLLGIVDDLETIQKGNSDFITNINGLQSELKAGMTNMLSELEANSANPNPNDPFQDKMEAFAQKAKEQMKVLLDDVAELNKAQKAMNAWFAVDKDIDLIDMLSKFRAQLTDALEENKKREEMEAKQAKKKKRVVIKKKKTTTKTRRAMPGGIKNMNKMDDIDGDGGDGGTTSPRVVKRKVVRKKVVKRVKKQPAGGAASPPPAEPAEE